MRKNKKGDLSLSINAIVILILAITMLGLGLAFMRNIFGGATQELTKVSGTVEKQLIEQMKEQNKVIDISRPKVELKQGQSDQIAIGLKNDGNSAVNFIIGPVTSTQLGVNESLVCNAKSNESKGLNVRYILTPLKVVLGDVRVVPVNIIASSQVDPTTCFFEVNVCKTDVSNSACITNDPVYTIELTVDIIR